MAAGNADTVIHRKARGAREEYQARAMSPAKALRLGLSQSADALFDLPLVVTTVEQTELPQTALRDELAGGGLLVLLDGPEGTRGAVRLDDALLTALIEVQTTGRVSGRAGGGRTVTRTDAAIAAPLIDAALAGAEGMLTGEDAHQWATGYRFGVMMDDPRGMSLALAAPAFHAFSMMVELGEGAHPGALTILLPVPEPTSLDGKEGEDGAMGRTLEQNALDAPVSLSAVLGRVTLPLEKIAQLAEGGRLPVTMDRPMQVSLEASQKHVVAHATLGQLNGARAVRLGLARSGRHTDHEEGAPGMALANAPAEGLPERTRTAGDKRPALDAETTDPPALVQG